MRIQAYNNLQQVYNQRRVPQAAEVAKAAPMDNVQISSIGRDILTAKNAVKNAPDVREDVIAPLKDRIQNGTYDVPTEDFADKLMAAWKGEA